MSTRWFVSTLCALALVPAMALGLTVADKSYPATLTASGKALKLVGAGLREKWMFDVYALGVYSESGACGPKAVIGADEVKLLRLDMLRDVSAKDMAKSIGESFGKAMPKDASAELKKQKATFIGYFKKPCNKGNQFEFTYVPGEGTHLKQNGKAMGPVIPGKAFADVFWGIYFGPKTCCGDLKKQLLKTCKGK